MRHSHLLSPLAAACLVLSCGASRADEWVLDRSIALRLSHNDNISMQAVNPESATYLTLSPSLNLASRTESRDVALVAGVSANQHVEKPKNDTVDHNLGLSLKLAQELDQWSMAASSVRNSTQTSELAKTGVVTARRQRTQNDLQGSWVRSFDETTSGSLSLGATQVRYEQGPGLVDFDDSVVAAGLRKVVSERASLTATLSAREFRTATGDSRTRVDGVALGGQWQYSERLGFGLDVGRQRTRSEQTLNAIVCPFGGAPCFPVSASSRSETSASNFAGSLAYKYERGSVDANLSRGLTASGTGSLLRTDAGGVGYTHRFDDTLTIRLGGTLTRSRYLDNAAAETRFSSLSSSLNWQLDQWFALSAGLTHSTQRAAGQAEATGANLVFVNLSWGFAPLSRSR